MESFQWNSYFETGICDVDNQHRVLVGLINRLSEFLSRANALSLEVILDVVDDLVAYSGYHFAEEEGVMRGVDIDPRHLDKHLALHAAFISDVTLFRSNPAVFKSAGEAARLLNYLIHWLGYHILGTDRVMARQVLAIQAGLLPDEAFRTQEHIRDSEVLEPMLHALNGLFHQVSQRNRELMELNQTLEKKVAERTQDLMVANQRLEKLAMTDVLTGLPNRRHALIRLELERTNADEGKRPLSVLMIDADGFKQINDSYGHEAGDEVLRAVARCLRDSVRTDDLACRLGGDEFMIICPNTSLEGALLIAEEVRQGVAELRVPVGIGEWRGSVSIGVATQRPGLSTVEDLIKAADEGVYAAKDAGRNCVRLQPQDDSAPELP